MCRVPSGEAPPNGLFQRRRDGHRRTRHDGVFAKPAHLIAAEADPHMGYSTAAAVEAATALGVGGIDAKTPT
jgi:hypothetical protein